MPVSEKRQNDPRFWKLSEIANAAVADACKKAGLDPNDLMFLEAQAGRVVDGLTSLLFRLADRKRA